MIIKNIKITIEYDGTSFSGWQVQPDKRTVQQEIETALKSLLGYEVKIIGAGRTDAGVHALGQVANFKINSDIPVDAFKFGLKKYLPDDIIVLNAEQVQLNFNSRRDAVKRTYRYVLSRKKRAIGRNYSWMPLFTFDPELMKKAVRFLLGEHDFSSFCKVKSNTGDCLSTVFRADIIEEEEYIIFEIEAIRFFHNMIRIIVGTLLEVGRGTIDIDDFNNILNNRDRTKAGPTVPPKGLFLVNVEYPKNKFNPEEK